MKTSFQFKQGEGVMKWDFKIVLVLVMLTFLSVNCGSESDSGEDDDELPEFEASESADTTDAVSVFEMLVEENEVGSEDDSGEADDSSGAASPDDLQGQPVTVGSPMSCTENCE